MFKNSYFRMPKRERREIRKSGFTLLEVLISLVLIGIGIFSCTKIFVTAKYFIKQAEHKSRAMELADTVMNQYITKSFNELGDLEANGNPVENGSAVENPQATGSPLYFYWTVNVSTATLQHNSNSNKVNDIPYRTITVLCYYDEENANGLKTNKSVRMANIVPYPYMHLYESLSSPGKSVKYYADACPVSGTPPCDNTSAAKIASFGHLSDATIIEYSISPAVKSDLQIFYNIAVEIDPSTSADIDVTDLIITRCFLVDSNGKKTITSPETGTPILTQGTISNGIIYKDLPAVTSSSDKYTLKVVWFKDHDRGTITAKRVNIIIFQVENGEKST